MKLELMLNTSYPVAFSLKYYEERVSEDAQVRKPPNFNLIWKGFMPLELSVFKITLYWFQFEQIAINALDVNLKKKLNMLTIPGLLTH